MLTAERKFHGIVNGNRQLQLPALPFVGGTVFSRRHGEGFLRLRFENREAVGTAQVIGHIPQVLDIIFVAVVFLPCFHTYRVDDQMGMDMVTVGVGCHHYFETVELLRQLQRNLMCSLGCQIFVRVEGLNQMIEHPPISFVVEPLGVQKLLIGAPGNAVDTGHKKPVAVFCFIPAAAVAECAVETFGCLVFDSGYELNRRHRPTAFASGFPTADCS